MIGRKHELASLKSYYDSGRAEFVALYGRRRVGKTYLVNEFFGSHFAFSIIGVIDGMELALPHYDQDKQFLENVLSQGKYAISHSPEYREAYAPHYRIVSRDIFDRDLKPLLPCQCCH